MWQIILYVIVGLILLVAIIKAVQKGKSITWQFIKDIDKSDLKDKLLLLKKAGFNQMTGSGPDSDYWYQKHDTSSKSEDNFTIPKVSLMEFTFFLELKEYFQFEKENGTYLLYSTNNKKTVGKVVSQILSDNYKEIGDINLSQSTVGWLTNNRDTVLVEERPQFYKFYLIKGIMTQLSEK